jgi:hypothetical protein
MAEDLQGKLTIPVARLLEAISSVVPPQSRSRRKQPYYPVDLWVPAAGLLRLGESRYELTGYDLPAVVTCWPDRVQLEGHGFRRIMASYSADELLEVHVAADTVIINSGRSRLTIPRLDAPGRSATKRDNLPRLRRSKVQVEDLRPTGRAELDATWGFSARMPVEHHKHPDSTIPDGRKPGE